jgi:hypothetical protein
MHVDVHSVSGRCAGHAEKKKKKKKNKKQKK